MTSRALTSRDYERMFGLPAGTLDRDRLIKPFTPEELALIDKLHDALDKMRPETPAYSFPKYPKVEPDGV